MCISDLQMTVIVVCNLKLIVNPIAVSLLFTFSLSLSTPNHYSPLTQPPPLFFVCITHSLSALPSPFSFIPSLAFSEGCVARRQDSLPIVSAQKGVYNQQGWGTRDRCEKESLRKWEIKNGGLRGESVVVVLWPHSSRSNCFLLNLAGFFVSCSAGGGQEQQAEMDILRS